ncbi:MAG: SprT family zinc-dependent metalloprotease [Gemmatimonadaceae bacterium]
MSTEGHEITVSGVQVRVVHKAIKNLHLGVYPPNGRVRVAAPLAVGDAAVRLAVIGRLAWIKRQRAQFAAQERQSARELVSGESHYFLGRRYRLRVVEGDGPGRVTIVNRATLELRVRCGSRTATRERVLQRWYRECLRELATPLIAKWEAALRVRPVGWGVRKMKTQWGTCRADERRVWLNVELVKKPAPCLEYLIVHELMHLIERHHTDRFVSLMDRYLPDWRLRRRALNSAPLGHESWSY